MIFKIFTEYKNGNKKIYDKLLRNKDIFNESGNYITTDLLFNDPILEEIAHKAYNVYRKPYKFKKGNSCPKFHEMTYCGTLSDVRSELWMVLHDLFKCDYFYPKSSKAIYEQVNYNLLVRLGENIKTSQYAFSENTVNDDGEKISILDMIPKRDLRFYGLYEMNTGYYGVYREIHDIVTNYDIKKLLRSNAHVQRNIIDLIQKYYKPCYDDIKDMQTYPEQKDMIEYYEKEYGVKISQPEYSAALENIFQVIIQCTVSLKAKNIKRSDFINNKKEGKQ